MDYTPVLGGERGLRHGESRGGSAQQHLAGGGAQSAHGLEAGAGGEGAARHAQAVDHRVVRPGGAHSTANCFGSRSSSSPIVWASPVLMPCPPSTNGLSRRTELSGRISKKRRPACRASARRRRLPPRGPERRRATAAGRRRGGARLRPCPGSRGGRGCGPARDRGGR